jgi:segregation and condensation protein B
MDLVARQVEALLFLSPQPLPFVRLCELSEASPADVQHALAALGERHAPDTGLEVVEIAGGWALRTRADLGATCDRLRARPPEERLSPAALETLAVVAYLEPVSRPEISRLRGVTADATVALLLERGMLEEAGRDPEGGAMRFRTTAAFQERFGLRGPGALPPIDRFELTGDEAEAVRRRLAEGGLLEEHAEDDPEPDADGAEEGDV